MGGLCGCVRGGVGTCVGLCVGLCVGGAEATVGLSVGDLVGTAVGVPVGAAVGKAVGKGVVGKAVGKPVGKPVGDCGEATETLNPYDVYDPSESVKGPARVSSPSISLQSASFQPSPIESHILSVCQPEPTVISNWSVQCRTGPSSSCHEISPMP